MNSKILDKSLDLDPVTHICEGQHVIITLPSGHHKIVKLIANQTVSLGKFGSFKVDDVLRYPLGTQFAGEEQVELEGIAVDGGQESDSPIDREENTSSDQNELAQDESVISALQSTTLPPELAKYRSSQTNQDLINIGSAIQKMTAEEIERLKKQSYSSEKLISAIIESHANFHKKTAFSQEKYLQRKKQKFGKHFTIDYLGGPQLLQYLLDKNDIQRVMDLTSETISQIMNLANIRSNGTYLCMDESGGVLVYSLLERMFSGATNSSDTGKIVVLHENEHVNLDVLKYSNYSQEFLKKHVQTVSMLEFFEPPTLEEIEERFKPLPREQIQILKSGQKNTYYRKLKWYNQQLQIITNATNTKYDALVLATTLYLPTLMPRLGAYVHGSRPIVCYSQFKEVLLELAHELYGDLRYLAPTLLETRCRPYQTIRGRLHPVMTMRSGGGYMLWCHKVLPVEEGSV